MIFEFSEFQLPEIPDSLKGPRWERLKHDLAAVMFDQRAQVFADQKSNDGPWQPLSPHYQRSREPGHKILRDTAILISSFTPEAGGGSGQKIAEIGEDFVRIATNVAYAAIHNYGGVIQIPENRNGFGKGIVIPAHSVTIPARPFDQFTDDQLRDIEELIRQFLNGE